MFHWFLGLRWQQMVRTFRMEYSEFNKCPAQWCYCEKKLFLWSADFLWLFYLFNRVWEEGLLWHSVSSCGVALSIGINWNLSRIFSLFFFFQSNSRVKLVIFFSAQWVSFWSSLSLSCSYRVVDGQVWWWRAWSVSDAVCDSHWASEDGEVTVEV